ncbi:MAG TPA: serine/threonine-protein kinase [Rhodoferax sp.]|nr:serine/threonine-protein kinase [Rhodoferax sp.]
MTTISKIGKYLIRRELGQGAMGIVYEGFDPVIERTVAIKTILPSKLTAADSTETLARFKREAQSAGRLNHPGIVAIYEYGEVVPERAGAPIDPDATLVDASDVSPDATAIGSASGQRIAFIAMEFVKGRELKDFFEANERFKPADVARLMGEILAAMGHAHAHGVVHRDIKPANLIVLDDGRVKIADFGIARIERSELTQMGTIMGTPSYMSPEQFMGQTVDGRSDLFSCGVVLYQLLTGEKPFTGNTTTIMYKVLREEPIAPSLLNLALPPAFDEVLRKAIAKSPEQRFQTAAEFNAAVQAALSRSATVKPAPVAPAIAAAAASPAAPIMAPVAAQPTVPLPVIRERAPGKFLWAGAAALISLAVVGIGTFLWTATGPGNSGKAGVAATTSAVVAPSATPALPTAVVPVAPSAANDEATRGTLVVSALGLVDPADPRFHGDAVAARAEAQADARRQLVEKVLVLYVEKKSLESNYPLLEQKLLSQAGSFIKTTLREDAPIAGKDGLLQAQSRAVINVRDIQKSLNQLSKEERINFIRNNGDPRVAIAMTVTNVESATAMPSARSQLAENVLKERIKSFGFRVWANDGEVGTTAQSADFLIQGDAKIKHLSMKLPASGLTITKSVLTSWTVKASDKLTGEEIYLNTLVPKGQSWASEDQALVDIGRLVGDEFSRDFFLQHFSAGVVSTRLNIAGLPDAATAQLLLRELRGIRQVLDVQLIDAKGSYSLELAQGNAGEIVQEAVMRPLNAKLGQNCFAFAGANSTEVRLTYSNTCQTAAIAGRFETAPPAGVLTAPAQRSAPLLKNAAVKAIT